MNNSVLHLFAFLCHIYAPLYCSFARKKPLLSTTTKEVFPAFGAKIGQNTEKTVVGAVIATVPATVFAFSRSKMQAAFWVSLLSKERGKMMSGRI